MESVRLQELPSVASGEEQVLLVPVHVAQEVSVNGLCAHPEIEV